MPALPHDDSELLARLQRGDEAAFELIFREHYERLCAAAARVLDSDGAAEELVQDVLFHVWDRRAAWDVSQTIAGYLFMAVRNRALNQLRRDQLERRWRDSAQHTHDTGAIPAAAEATDARVSTASLEAAIEQTIAALPPRCRQAFILRREQNLSYAEIARIMEIAPKTVEVQIGAALRALRKSLAEWL